MTTTPQPGIGPHPLPWPADDRLDPTLLKEGDTRNVEDKYRYWKESAIITDLDKNGVQLQIAVENTERDFNMGTIVRSANAFGVRHVHVIGRKQWNKRGAMVTDRYLHIHYYRTTRQFLMAMQADQRSVIAVDNVDGSTALSGSNFSERIVLVFGQEGPGLSREMLVAAEQIVAIEQSGSTRSINVGVAAGIAMYVWTQQYILKN